MTAGFELRCLECGARRGPTVRELRCKSCGGLFEVTYGKPPSKDAPRLPLARPGERISLGEGRTPVVALRRIARELGLGGLWAKLEYQAPTGSFKDRGGSWRYLPLRRGGSLKAQCFTSPCPPCITTHRTWS